MIPGNWPIFRYCYSDILQPLGNDTPKLLEKTYMNKLNEIIAKFDQILEYRYPEVLQQSNNLSSG